MSELEDLENRLEIFTARGQVRYRCPACSFDSYTTTLVVKHFHETHTETRKLSGASLFDSKGNKISSAKEEIIVLSPTLRSLSDLNQPEEEEQADESKERQGGALARLFRFDD